MTVLPSPIAHRTRVTFAEAVTVTPPAVAEAVAGPAGRGLDGGPEDGVSILPLPPVHEPLPPVDETALAQAKAATMALVRQGKVTNEVQAMVIPSQREVLVTVEAIPASASKRSTGGGPRRARSSSPPFSP
ncbi:hypothetical protein [Streptomyces atroolivaceus]|uniref:hypothetical protein n=1 Tax=Streptomyces atroolivaceus TaxID=66869 RepID=UPI0036841D32